MDSQTDRRPKVRRGKNFVVEENIDTIRWPPVCSNCGGRVEQTENIALRQRYKTFGQISVEVVGIPYCRNCFTKSRTADRLDTVIVILTFLSGVPLGFLFTAWAIQGGTRGSSPTIIWLAMTFGLAIAICYGLLSLLLKRPIKFFFRDRFVDPVSAWLIEEKKSSGQQGLSVVIAIPNKRFADQFAQLNGAAI
jgi:hypothetical protein